MPGDRQSGWCQKQGDLLETDNDWYLHWKMNTEGLSSAKQNILADLCTASDLKEFNDKGQQCIQLWLNHI